MPNTGSLISYFSRKGNNYVDGRIVHLSIGNTEVIAKKIQKLTGSDLFQIKTIKPYPDDYTEATNVAHQEKTENARPELLNKVENMDSYDVIYLGYPNWWGTVPMAVLTFLEAHDLSKKTIFPFCTHEGSGMGNSVQDIRKACPHSKVLAGLAIRGGSVDRADKDIKSFLETIGMLP